MIAKPTQIDQAGLGSIKNHIGFLNKGNNHVLGGQRGWGKCWETHRCKGVWCKRRGIRVSSMLIEDRVWA